MLASIIAIAVLGQLRPDTMLDSKHDAAFCKWIQDAKKQADRWAYEEPNRIFSQKMLRKLSLTDYQLFRRMVVLRDRAEPIFRKAAYEQICDAYDISFKEFRTIVANPDVAKLRNERERFRNDNGQRIQMATRFGGLDRTRFDPSKVRLPKPYDRIAGRNPAPKPSPPKVFSDEAERRGAGKPDQSTK